MPAKKIMFSLAIAAMVGLPVGIANAGDVNIQTDNVQMLLDENGGVFIRTAPVSPVIVSPAVKPTINRNHRTRVNRRTNNRANTIIKCRNVTQRRSSSTGNNRIFTSSTTSVCS